MANNNGRSKKIAAGIIAVAFAAMLTTASGPFAFAQQQGDQTPPFEVTTSQVGESLQITVRLLGQELEEEVEAAITDSENATAIIANITAETAADEDFSEGVAETLDVLVNGTDDELPVMDDDIVEEANVTAGEVAAEAVVEVVVAEAIANNATGGGLEEAAVIIAEELVEQLVEPAADPDAIAQEFEDAMEEAGDVIEDSFNETQVAAIITELESDTVVEAVEDGTVNATQEIVEITGETVEEEDITVDPEPSPAGPPAGNQTITADNSGIESRLSAIEDRLANIEENVREGTSLPEQQQEQPQPGNRTGSE